MYVFFVQDGATYLSDTLITSAIFYVKTGWHCVAKLYSLHVQHKLDS